MYEHAPLFFFFFCFLLFLLRKSHAYIALSSISQFCIKQQQQVSPLQVLMGRYKIQYVAARSHTRINSVAGDLNEEWLQALFLQISDPSCGILLPADDGSLEINGQMPIPKDEDDPPDPAILSYFYALGNRAYIYIYIY
jgi:hypothetical protein